MICLIDTNAITKINKETNSINLYPYQSEVLDLLKSGSILCGGVGSGKSITSLAYYFEKECEGDIKDDHPLSMKKPRDLYIITTAKKRNTLEWLDECCRFRLGSKDPKFNVCNVQVVIDSWNNIDKYTEVKNAFFIFDEQRVVGYGAWVKSFLKITKKNIPNENHWILLTATPGDTWIEYAPVFIANGFYKNKSDFIRKHVVYNPRTSFPKIDRYINCGELLRHKNDILVTMRYRSPAKHTVIVLDCLYDKDKYGQVFKNNWNVFTEEPIVNAAEACYTMRKVINSDLSRYDQVLRIISKWQIDRVIIFYNFDYELEILRTLSNLKGYEVAEYNGHKHQQIPSSDKWIYIVQYNSGSEAWNCIETPFMIFYSLDYSFKKMKQSSGRIDRKITPFKTLYYFVLKSQSSLDHRIIKALKERRVFNENDFMKEIGFASKTTHIMEGEEEYA